MTSEWLTTPESTTGLDGSSDNTEDATPLYFILLASTMVLIALIACTVYRKRVLQRLIPRYRVVSTAPPI